MGLGKSTLFSILPPGTRYRELWLPELINNHATLPSSIAGGHPLTLNGGARKGTTADGVHFTGANDSNINCGAIHNNSATNWVSLRFKFDQDYAAGSGDMYLWGKFVDATHFVWLVFKTADGKLYFEGKDGGVNDFSVAAQDGAADITTWEAGRWYHVLASISALNDVRFIIDNGTVVTAVTAITYPNGGDFIIGDYDDPGAGTGFEGVIADFLCGDDNLATGEESDLFKNVPPLDIREIYTLDEGRGTTANNRGLAGAGANGTLDTNATWKFGQVQQPVLSLDNRNDYAISAAAVVDIAGDITLVWVGKMKCIYTTTTRAADKYMIMIHTGNDNRIAWMFANGINTLRWFCDGGTVVNADCPTIPAIDDYWIMIGTYTVSGDIALFINGRLVASDTGGDTLPGGLTRACLGAYTTPDRYDGSRPLFAALINGAFTEREARTFSKELNGILGLGLAI